MDSSYDMIAALSDLRGISGREAAVGKAVAERIRPYAPDVRCDDGNIIARIGQDSAKPSLMFCAHLDQVGFFVTDITPEGFLRIGAVGGVDHRLLLGQPVTVLGTETLSGVISILPPHLLKGEQAVPDDTQLCVDLGFDSADALRGKVSRGDAVCFAAKCRPLLGTRMTGSALDDRCGAASLILAAEQISRMENLPCNVIFAFAAQEERSGRGAKRAAFAERPDYAIAVDVTFGLAYGESEQETFALGGGPAIGISSVLDPEVSDALTHTAKNHHIPYQIEIMPEATGTDADALALAPNGCKAGTVSIPLRYMHTPVEVIDIRDVELTAQLLAAFAGRCGTI